MGGLKFDIDRKWVPVPVDVDAVVYRGFCGAIPANDRLKAPKHKILRTRLL